MTHKNVIIICTDQQRFDTIYSTSKQKEVVTPNIDQLIKDGIIFENATTPSPVCMPARCSLFSGQWVTNHGCLSNHYKPIKPKNYLFKTIKEAGYATALIGKNHSFLTSEDLDFLEEHPNRKNKESKELEHFRNKEKNAIDERMVDIPLPGGIKGTEEGAKTDAAIKWILQQDQTPFCIMLSYLYPHTPYEAPDPFFSEYSNKNLSEAVCEECGLEKAEKPFRQIFHQQNNNALMAFDDRQIKKMKQVYYASISYIDYEIGKFIDFLKVQGIYENSIIFFISDHGDYMGDHGLFTKSPALYDCLEKIPFIVKYEKNCAGKTSKANVSLIDIFPTLLDMIDIAVPNDVDGKSFLDILNGQDQKIREAGYAEYGIPGIPYSKEKLAKENIQAGTYENPFIKGLPWEGNPISLAGKIFMWRTEKYKLIWEPNGISEFYDLLSDPYELNNLYKIPVYSEIIENMKIRLKSYIKENLKNEKIII